MSTDGLDGKVALIDGGGDSLGRSIALALAARGVRIVVCGKSERALGETVGEIAYGGGKARHVVVGCADDLDGAVLRAVEVFGGLDLVVGTASDAELFGAAAPKVGEGGTLVAVGVASDLPAAPAARSVARHVVEAGAELDPDVVAQLVVFLCSRAGRGLDGRTVAIR
jgi:hypothetical protein